VSPAVTGWRACEWRCGWR